MDKRIPSKYQFLDFRTLSGENLLNSSCHFPNHKSIIYQILLDSCVMKYTTLYFFRSNVVYFAQKGPMKVQIFRLFSAQIKIHQILVIFETKNKFHFKFCTTLIPPTLKSTNCPSPPPFLGNPSLCIGFS